MLLYPLLQEYLINNGKLPLPEPGLLTIDNEPAHLQKTNNSMVAPTTNILFVPIAMQESEMQNLISFSSKKLNISFGQAQELLNQENVGDTLFKEMADLIKWPDTGNIRNKNKQQAKGSARGSFPDYLPSFSIEKIYRQPVTPAETVAQPAEITSVETYQEYEKVVVKDYWWVWAIAILVISVLLILFRYA